MLTYIVWGWSGRVARMGASSHTETELPVKYQTFLTTCDTTEKRKLRGWKMKWPKSEEFSGTVNCSHLGVELAPLKIAYAEPDSPSAERTALRRASAAFRKKWRFARTQLEMIKGCFASQRLISWGSTNSTLENPIF